MFRRPSRSTLCPYTTLFRSDVGQQEVAVGLGIVGGVVVAQCGLTSGLGPHLQREALFVGELLADPESGRSEEHTSELQSRGHLVCRLLLEKKNEVEKKTEND